MKTLAWFGICILLSVTLTGCGSGGTGDMSRTELRKWVGENVKVQFRRDALGAAAALPVPPTTGTINGAEVMVFGELLRVDASSITINRRTADIPTWIPREAILLIEQH